MVAQDSRLAELRDAVSALSPNASGNDQSSNTAIDQEAEEQRQRNRALANWEPGYPGERIDYYEEFIQRHADINCDWIDVPQSSNSKEGREATGVGVLADDGSGSKHAVAPLDDGSMCIWDISARSTIDRGGCGSLVGHSGPGHLTGRPDVNDSHTIMTETGAVECVSIDSQSQKGYFAVQNLLHEVDLRTLQLASTKEYPFPITTLSACSSTTPLAVGTNNTVHLYDPREPGNLSSTQANGTGELIGGSLDSHATLSQPGPLSILHDPASTSIWVSGRFTSLLNYDLRHFPRLLGTLHSGARIASLTSLPHPFIPRELDLVRNPEALLSALHAMRTAPGTTLLAAAEYKGKGSLEMYGLPGKQGYQNRQTASASKLLSAQPHGGRIVFSDGDGNLRWFERDCSTHVRSWNINSALPDAYPDTGDASMGGIFSSSASEMPGQGDIVQKILPIPSSSSSTSRPDLSSEPLLLWTGDGRLGMLNFGQRPLAGDEAWHDAVEAQAASAEDKAKEDAERQYGMAMRRALERNADEVRFVRGLGIGYGI